MEEGSFNSASYGVAKAAEGGNLWLRRALLFGFIAFSVGFCLLFTVVLAMPVVIAVLPVLWLIFYPFFLRLLTYDCEYSFEHGELSFERLYKNKKRKKLFSVTAKDCTAIAPMTADFRPADFHRVIDLRGSRRSPDSYYLAYCKDGKDTAVCFEATQKLVRLLSRYNEKTIVSKELRY